ncbi:hypothetical protein SSPO_022540 [Streptomyces antimycoticus]|uniref:Uncharacterized protein n=1 Tax=Streptomyces antimycoticus TaxID=68175 RepID=A0A4D4KDG9_9ACTN|nr:hypothetical protein SSPO_022540 [Streptomyces antimycoticus]GDY47005.1 hypothetical protein SANT12839_078870 [Streptomyces antimycoticus]
MEHEVECGGALTGLQEGDIAGGHDVASESALGEAQLLASPPDTLTELWLLTVFGSHGCDYCSRELAA